MWLFLSVAFFKEFFFFLSPHGSVKPFFLFGCRKASERSQAAGGREPFSSSEGLSATRQSSRIRTFSHPDRSRPLGPHGWQTQHAGDCPAIDVNMFGPWFCATCPVVRDYGMASAEDNELLQVRSVSFSCPVHP